MERGDFEFPPDPSIDGVQDLTATAPMSLLPLRVLSSTPIDQLPPTLLPAEQQERPIRHVMRSLLRGPNRPMRRPALLQTQSEETNPQTHRDNTDADPTVAKEGGETAAGGISSTRGVLSGPKRSRFDWTDEEIADFYKLLSQYGTDFNAIAVLYPGRTRDDIKRLYLHELRKRRDEVRMALEKREEIDLGTFRAHLKRREEMNQAPTRRLDQEEEETLRLIEAGTLENRSQTAGGCMDSDAAADNGDFDFDAPDAAKDAELKERNRAEVKSASGASPRQSVLSKHEDSEEDDMTLVEIALHRRGSVGSRSLPTDEKEDLTGFNDPQDDAFDFDSESVGKNDSPRSSRQRTKTQRETRVTSSPRKKKGKISEADDDNDNDDLTLVEIAKRRRIDAHRQVPAIPMDELDGFNEPLEDDFFEDAS